MTYVRGVSASLVAGTVAGLIWYYFFKYTTFTGGIIVAAAIGLGIGYLVGECVAWASNRRSAPPLQWVAAAGVVLAYGIRVSLLLASDEWTVRTLFAFREFETLAILATAVGAWFAAMRVR